MGPRAPAGGHGLLCDSLRQRGHAFRRQPQQALRRRRVTVAAVTGQWVKGERRMTEKAMAHSGKHGGSEDAAAASSAATPMAAARLGAERSERQGVRGAMERRERSECEWRGSLWRPPGRAQGHGCTRQQGSAMVGRARRHGGHVQDTRHPMRQIPEQVAVSNVGTVGAVIGPSLG